MIYSLSMSFVTSTGEKTTMKISDVKGDLTEEQIKNLMDDIISNDVFLTAKGAFSAKAGAQLVEKDETEYSFR